MAEPRYGIGTIMVMLKHCEDVSKMLWVRLKELADTEDSLEGNDLAALGTWALGLSEEVKAASIATQRMTWEADSESQVEEVVSGGINAVSAMNFISTYCCSKRNCEDNCVFHSQRYGCLLKDHPTQWSLREEVEDDGTI